jgi:hypothetical protein
MNLEQKPKRINTDTENLEILLCVVYAIYMSARRAGGEYKKKKKEKPLNTLLPYRQLVTQFFQFFLEKINR